MCFAVCKLIIPIWSARFTGTARPSTVSIIGYETLLPFWVEDKLKETSGVRAFFSTGHEKDEPLTFIGLGILPILWQESEAQYLLDFD